MKISYKNRRISLTLTTPSTCPSMSTHTSDRLPEDRRRYTALSSVSVRWQVGRAFLG